MAPRISRGGVWSQGLDPTRGWVDAWVRDVRACGGFCHPLRGVTAAGMGEHMREALGGVCRAVLCRGGAVAWRGSQAGLPLSGMSRRRP